MNWKLYYSTIHTQEDYDMLKSTGMAWEIFDMFPNSFQEGQEFYKEWKWANE